MKKLMIISGFVLAFTLLLVPFHGADQSVLKYDEDLIELQGFQNQEIDMKQMIATYDERGYDHQAVMQLVEDDLNVFENSLEALPLYAYELKIGDNNYILDDTSDIALVLEKIYNDTTQAYDAQVVVNITPSLTVFTSIESEDSRLVSVDMVDDVSIVRKEVAYTQIKEADQVIKSLDQPEVCVVLESSVESVIKKDVTVVNDPSLTMGAQTTVSNGRDGVKATITRTTLLNDAVISEEILSEVVIKEPINQVVSRGTGGIIASEVLDQLQLPVKDYLITSEFGVRWNREHRGVDLAVSIGTPVYAAGDGIVTISKYKGDYGYLIEIDHGDGVVTRYAHNSQLLVSSGTSVEKGGLIAYSGNSGYSTGPHVHFELILNGIWVNPLIYAN